METLIFGLGPAFAAGFGIQQLIEILDPIWKTIFPKEDQKTRKKAVLGIISLVLGLLLAFGAGLRVLEPLGVKSAGGWDLFLTGVIISGGTEFFNSLVKFLDNRKEPTSDNSNSNN